MIETNAITIANEVRAGQLTPEQARRHLAVLQYATDLFGGERQSSGYNGKTLFDSIGKHPRESTSHDGKRAGEFAPKHKPKDQEMLSAGFPPFIVDPEDREKLEKHAPAELNHWREQVVHHRNLNHSNGGPAVEERLRHRGILENAYKALKTKYHAMKRK
jgi:hypothetical protein